MTNNYRIKLKLTYFAESCNNFINEADQNYWVGEFITLFIASLKWWDTLYLA